MNRLALATALALSLSTFAAPKAAPAPKDPDKAFAAADQAYADSSWLRACTRFSDFVKLFPDAPQFREAAVKRVRSCQSAGMYVPPDAWKPVREIAITGQDYARSLAELTVGIDPAGALDRFKQWISTGTPSQKKEARRLYVERCMGQVSGRPENALPWAERLYAIELSPAEKDQVDYRLALTRLVDAKAHDRGVAELEEIATRKSALADDALYMIGNWYQQQNTLDKALEYYDRLTARFSAANSNVYSLAREQARGIREPYLNLSAPQAPEGKPTTARIDFRNLTGAKLRLLRVDPTRQDPKLMLAGSTLLAGDEVKAVTVDLKEPAPHQPGNASVDLGVLELGYYRVEVRSGALFSSAQLFSTDLATVVKNARGAMVIFTASRDGRGVGGTPSTVYFHDRDGAAAKASCTADAHGLCQLSPAAHSGYPMQVWSGKDGHYTRADVYPQAWYQAQTELLAYAFTDRPLYKPGETVGIKVLLRRRADGPTEPLNEGTANVVVSDPQGRQLRTTAVTTDRFGAADLSVPLGKGAALGVYSISIYGTGGREYEFNGAQFDVEEYKAPEYTVAVDAAAPPELGKPVKVKVTASFFFGGPVAKATGRAVITEQPYNHVFGPWADDLGAGVASYNYGYNPYGYRYGYAYVGAPPPLFMARPPYNPYARGYQPIFGQTTVELKTADDGTAEFEIPNSAKLTSSRTFSIAVTLTDSSRREVTGSGSVNISDQKFFADVRTDRSIYKPGERIKARVRAEDANGHPASPQVLLRLSRLVDGDKLAKVMETKAQLKDGFADAELDADALGAVRIEVRQLDGKDEEPALAQSDAWLTNEAKPIVPPWAGYLLYADTSAPLEAGKPVRVLLVMPTENTDALLTVESDRLHHAEVVELKGRSRFLELPLTHEMAPNVWINVSHLENLMLQSMSAPVRLRATDTDLKVDVAWAKPSAEPGTSLPLSVKVANAKGPSQVAVTVVDEAIYAIAPERKDLLEFFARRPRALSVQTVVSAWGAQYRPYGVGNRYAVRPGIADLGSSGKGAMRKPMEEPMPSAAAGAVPAAPRAMAAPAAEAPAAASPAPAPTPPPAMNAAARMAPVKVRKDFTSSAGWFPREAAPAVLKASFSDSLTSWRATAVALTTGPQLGVGRAVARTQKPLMVRLEAPRFFTERDEVTISAMVTSRLDKAEKVDVRFDAPGLKALSGASQTVEVAPGADVRVDARFAAVEPGRHALKVTARAATAADAMEWTLPELIHGVAERKVFAGRLSASQKFEVELPEHRNPLGTELVLHVSPSMAAAMFDALPYLAEYPYGCVEQTLSRFVPAAIARRTARDLGLPQERLPKDLDAMADAGLKRLYGFQHADGGWGWWRDDATDLWMTSYVVYGLALGREAGLEVQPAVLRKGRDYLKDHLGDAERNPETQAWVAYALARTGDVPDALLDTVYEGRLKLSQQSRAMLALALLARKDPRARVAVENLDDVVKTAREHIATDAGNPYSYWASGEMIETVSYALSAIARYDAKDERIPDLVDYLMSKRNQGRWQDTRDTAFAVYALADVSRGERAISSNGELVVSVNGAEARRIKYTRGGLDIVAPLRLYDGAFKPGVNAVEVKRADGLGTGWFAASWDVYNRDENVRAVENEVSIARKYVLLGKPSGNEPKVGAEAEYGIAVESGVRVRVELTITAKKPLSYVMVEDFKAAGLEPLLQQSGPAVCQWQCTNAELRPDRVAMFFSSLPQGTLHVSYEARAEQPGRFHALPARVEAMYQPMMRATSDEMRLEVRDARGPIDGVAQTSAP